MGWLNWVRSLEYFMEASRAARAMPTACAAMPILPPSNVCRAILNPPPNAPNRFSFGIRQSSKMSSAVDDALMPNFSSNLPTLKPGVPFSTINVEMPLCPCVLSVIAVITAISAWDALVMNNFVPLITQLLPSGTALVLILAASEPADGSVSPRHPILAPLASGARNLCFCSSAPAAYIGSQQRDVWAETITPVEAQATEISS